MSLLAALVLAGLPFHVETRPVDLVAREPRPPGVAPDVDFVGSLALLAPAVGHPVVQELPVVNRASTPFRDVLASWNIQTFGPTSFVVELRVRPEGELAWSPWLYLGAWGAVPEEQRVTSCDAGKVDVDYFRGERAFDGAQVRVRAFVEPADPAALRDVPRIEVRIGHVTLCLSDRERAVAPKAPPSPRPWGKVLDVPFRSQRTEKPEIAGRICSPTSLAMVLAYRGVDVPTLAVAERAYDAAHDLYGNWPQNVQAAYSFGVPGYLTRFSDWADVEERIAAGQPLIVSIGVKQGELPGAPYESTAGHLLVLCGFDERGDCVVNDPAVSDPKEGRRTYRRADLETVWMARGGTTYVLLPRP